MICMAKAPLYRGRMIIFKHILIGVLQLGMLDQMVPVLNISEALKPPAR